MSYVPVSKTNFEVQNLFYYSSLRCCWKFFHNQPSSFHKACKDSQRRGGIRSYKARRGIKTDKGFHRRQRLRQNLNFIILLFILCLIEGLGTRGFVQKKRKNKKKEIKKYDRQTIQSGTYAIYTTDATSVIQKSLWWNIPLSIVVLVLVKLLHFLYEGQPKPLHIFSVFPHLCSMWDLYGNSRALLRFIE